ncbi:PH domain-containing protein [Kribbella sp. NPDC003505]|uniref:PH domain-containing protein n=1 Tax=Kribbella sp. NPDC003505 TaxID=3154448 RepID=UPI0033A3B53B
MLVSWPLAIVYVAGSAKPWWLGLSTLIFLWPLYDELRGPCARLTVTAEGFEIRGVLRKRAFPWSAIERLQVRRYEVSVDLGRHGREAWRFDGQHGRPSAQEVAALLERLRLASPRTGTGRRTTPSWGAAVLLAGTAASISTAVVGLLVGTR